MALAQEANRYLDNKAPWKKINEDRDSAASSVFTVIGVISCLKTVLYPFLPFSSERLHSLLGFEDRLQDRGWAFVIPQAGQKLPPPEHLFAKLDDKIVEKESALLAQSSLHPS